MPRASKPPDDIMAKAGRWFPLFPGSKSKPMIKGWQRKGRPRAELGAKAPKQNCNWALNCGASGLLVIDVDPGGHELLQEVALANGGLPETYTVRTPRGGYHLYYKGDGRTTVNALAMNVDTRGSGGYVVAPGSVVNQSVYKVVNDTKPVSLPLWVAEALQRKHQECVDNQEPLVELDTPAAERKAEDYLLMAPMAIQGAGGDATTYQVACAVKDFGISQARCLGLMLEHWNEKSAIPPWDADALADKVANAYRYSQGAAGSKPPAEMVFTELAIAPLPGRLAMRRKRSGEYPIGQGPPDKWIVEGWIPDEPECVTMLTGHGGIGKSFLAAQLGAAAATGRKWLGLDMQRRCAVMAVLCEDSEQNLWKRLDGLRSDEFYPDLDKYPFASDCRIGEDSLMVVSNQFGALKVQSYAKDLRAELEDYRLDDDVPADMPILLILDTATDVFGANISDRSQVKYFLGTMLARMAMDLNLRIVLLNHPAKASDSEYAGTVGWHNGVRNRLFLKYEDPDTPGNGLRILSHSKFNSGIQQDDILMRQNGDGLFVTCDSVTRLDQVHEAVYRAIEAAADDDQPYHLVANSARCIHKVAIIKLENGKKVSGREIREAVNTMIEERVVKSVTGQPRGNGLFINKGVFDEI